MPQETSKPFPQEICSTGNTVGMYGEGSLTIIQWCLLQTPREKKENYQAHFKRSPLQIDACCFCSALLQLLLFEHLAHNNERNEGKFVRARSLSIVA